MMMMVAFDVVYWVRDPAPLLPLSCLVVLEPVEDVLALYLTVEAEVRGYVLDLISGWGPEPRSEQIRQYFNLFCGWIPTATTAFPSNSFHTNTWHSFVHIRPDSIRSDPSLRPLPPPFFFFLLSGFIFCLLSLWVSDSDSDSPFWGLSNCGRSSQCLHKQYIHHIIYKLWGRVFWY